MRRFVILLPTALLLGACGGEPARHPGDPRPRVEGTWRMVMTSRSGTEAPGRATWYLTPSCRYGACDLTLRRGSSKPRILRFDKVIGDYTGGWSTFTNCQNLATGELIAKQAYKVQTKLNLEVTASVRYRGRAYATAMTGQQFSRPLLQQGLEGECQQEVPATFDLRVVRAHPPRGTPRPVAPAGGAPPRSPPPAE
jgi:hypothetical protein